MAPRNHRQRLCQRHRSAKEIGKAYLTCHDPRTTRAPRVHFNITLRKRAKEIIARHREKHSNASNRFAL
jgi:hypothetical protein